MRPTLGGPLARPLARCECRHINRVSRFATAIPICPIRSIGRRAAAAAGGVCSARAVTPFAHSCTPRAAAPRAAGREWPRRSHICASRPPGGEGVFAGERGLDLGGEWGGEICSPPLSQLSMPPPGEVASPAVLGLCSRRNEPLGVLPRPLPPRPLCPALEQLSSVKACQREISMGRHRLLLWGCWGVIGGASGLHGFGARLAPRRQQS